MGVLAQEWPEAVKVVMFTVAADRTSQLAGLPSPVALRKVERMCEALGLGPDECVADVLLACGLNEEPTADHVAACSARLFSAGARGVFPAVVVFESPQALKLAKDAGLLDGNRFAPVGVGARAVVVTNKGRGAGWWERTIRVVGKILGRRSQPRTPPSALPPGAAQMLLNVLGDHRGHGFQTRGSRGWKRRPFPKLELQQVEDHLSGRYWVAPFDPRHPWPFVVVDIDRHHALGELHFDTTLAKVRAALPGALVMQSSPSRGAHVYVRVPPAFLYRTAALVVLTYLTSLGLRWLNHRGEGEGARGALTLRAELLEVPSQPVRLPFGLGSQVWGSTKPRSAQFADFLGYVNGTDFGAFDRAVDAVRKELSLTGAEWEKSKRGKMQRWLAEEETAEMPSPLVSATDPFAPLLGRLPPPVAKVAAAGIPSIGTRTRWTQTLIQELADLEPPDRVRELVFFWLKSRPHQSEDLEVRADRALGHAVEQIGSFYKKRVGVPVRFWAIVEQKIRAHHLYLSSTCSAGCSAVSSAACSAACSAESPAGCSAASSAASSARCSVASSAHLPPVLELLDTAFHILLRFYGEGRKSVKVRYTNFERFTGRNTSHTVREFMCQSKWMTLKNAHSTGRFSASYTLHDGIWPMRPEEPVYFVRP